ncbi:MAG TPA: hypothetical protein VHA07_07855 [Devosia sp.]|nr:hypothetical protein [Devosia sp.]
MRRLALCLAVMAVPGLAHAAGWTSQMEEDEGGSVMVASVDADAVGSIAPALRLMCAGSEGVNLRYQAAVDTVEPGAEADFLFESETGRLTRHMVYEDLDGAFAAYFPPSDPLIRLLKTGSRVSVSQPGGNSPTVAFTLAGSSKAIDVLLGTCK